jgi:hypothetical protein
MAPVYTVRVCLLSCSFNFLGVTYDSFGVCTNGFLSLGWETDCSYIPPTYDVAGQPGRIALLHSDLFLEGSDVGCNGESMLRYKGVDTGDTLVSASCKHQSRCHMRQNRFFRDCKPTNQPTNPKERLASRIQKRLQHSPHASIQYVACILKTCWPSM